MLWTLVAVLVALWFFGFFVYLVAGGVIHLWLRLRSPWRSGWRFASERVPAGAPGARRRMQ